MRRKSVLFSVVILFIVFLAIPTQAESSIKRFNLKLSGGYGNMTGGDMSNIADGLNSRAADIANILGFSLVGDLENAKWGPEFEGEIVYKISDRFEVGLGVGYMERKNESQVGVALVPVTSSSFSWEQKYLAIPINLNGYYNIPIAPRIKAFLKVGIGYYCGKFRYKVRQENVLLGVVLWSEEEGKATDNGIGFHGGFGFEFSMTKNIGFYIEGMGRYAKLGNWRAMNSHSDPRGTFEEAGTFWYVEELEVVTGRYYPSLHLSQDETSVEGLMNVRKAEISFSGFTFRAGIRIGF